MAIRKLIGLGAIAGGALWCWRWTRRLHQTPRQLGFEPKLPEPAPVAPSLPRPTAAPTATTAGDFFVYADNSHSRARIHRANCRYCNAGEGTQPGAPTTGEWHGPYAGFAAAERAAGALQLRDTAACRVCCAGEANAT